MGKLFVISGSSGVGKGTVIKEFLAKHPDFKLSVSCTTRKPREGEVHGINYFFLTHDEFRTCIERNEFLEWAEFSGNMYGTQKAYVETKLAEGKNMILEIDTQGALNVKKIMPEAQLIFILPPSFEELEARLRGRHTETEEAIQKRLQTVKSEMENSKQFDYQIVNDSIENAVVGLEKIMV
ncbi:MAG: guanylate kinase [Candidatus Gastranaerophilales bacterium]|nr:guanylate kinase [Candidatus Gastranaerophilales bacterium]MCM1072635.1 guanylate kinase [Bacteroides sp.]